MPPIFVGAPLLGEPGGGTEMQMVIMVMEDGKHILALITPQGVPQDMLCIVYLFPLPDMGAPAKFRFFTNVHVRHERTHSHN